MQDSRQPNGNQNISAALYADGMAACQKGQHVQAERLFAQLLMDDPGHADAWHMRGVCCMAMARLDEAETWIREAIQIRKDADFYANLGIVLAGVQKADEAIAAYRASLAINSGNARVCSNLGNLLRNRGELEEAQALYRQAIGLEPRYTHALANLGALLLAQNHYAEAEQVLRKCLEIDPGFLSAATTLGTMLEQTGSVAEAMWVWGRLLESLRMRADWDHLAQADAAYIRGLERVQGKAVPPWPLLNMPDLTPALQRKAAHDCARLAFGDALQRPALVNAVARDGLLRIGYLSADYFNHATMRLIAGVLEAHDPARVQVHLLSINARPAQESDPYARRLAAMPATFHDLSTVSDAQAAEQIARIAPHLLIDLKGYTTDARPGIAVRRPAPVIVNWLGYPGTLGHERLADYIIGDPVVTPPEHASDFSETLALMPHCYQPNDRSRPLGAPPARQEEGLPENGFVFCCFNQFIKINPGTFDVWCRLLAATPGSVLWLLDQDQQGQLNLEREARRRGVAGNRLVFAARKPIAEHLARLSLADLALDTFPCNSHTTASDALWAGVPIVTRIGQTFASRVAASLLTTHGLPELIAPDDEAYEKLALSLVNQPEKLRQLRQKLDAARLTSPLFDTVRFARDLERLYEAIWQQHNIPRDQRKPIVLPP
jgi:predicted O-linked N-acetylglucosamine transferase (SPINDLY family)